MDFELAPHQEAIKKVARDFVKSEFSQAVSQSGKEDVDRNILKKAGALGLLGITADPQYGGSGLDMLTYAVLIDEVSRVWWPAGALFSYVNSLNAFPLSEAGDHRQKQEYLVSTLSGDKLGSYALSEPDAGSDAASIKTKAELKGSTWIINGRKRFITNASIADYCIVFARTDKGSKPSQGISAIIVDTKQPGFQVEQAYLKMGLDSSPTCEVVLENAEEPEENLLGARGEGFKLAMKTLDIGRIGVAASAVGASQWALERTIEYVKQRKQFGQPIATFQGIQFIIADLVSRVEAARLLAYKAAWLKSQGKPFTKEASMAKLYATEGAVEVGIACQKLFGGYGYMKEFLIERMVRDVIAYTLFEGTSNIQRLIIVKELLLRGNV